MYEIDWSPRARRDLRKLADRELRARVVAAIGRLSNFPEVGGLEALRDHRYGFRLRVGSLRVLLDVDSRVRLVTVQEIRKRDESTY